MRSDVPTDRLEAWGRRGVRVRCAALCSPSAAPVASAARKAPGWAGPGMRVRHQGFSLLELMVVVAIVAVVSGAVIYAGSVGGGERRVEAEARRVVAVLRAVCDASAIEADWVAFGFGARYYAGYRMAREGWKPVESSGPLRAYELPPGVIIGVPGRQEPLPLELPESPQVLCSPGGDPGPAELDVVAPGAGPGWRISLDRSGQWRATKRDAP